MAPPAASSEGIAAQSDLGDTDDTSSLTSSIDMDRLRLRGQPLPLHSRSTLEPRSEALSKGGLAGVIVGIIIFFVLAVICAYPFIIRRIRGKRNGTNRLDTAETAFTPTPLRPSGTVPTTGPAASSRMSSRDSLGNKTEALQGLDRQSTKELNVSSHGTDPSKRDLGSYQRGYTGDDSSHAPSVTTRRGTDHTFDRASTWKSESSYPWTPVGIQLVATRADGMEYSDATQGHSATYYSPTIPSEAFGMVTPPPTDEPVSALPPRRSSSYASSLAKNLLQMFPSRRSSTKDSQSRGAKMQPTPELLREGLSDSPTQLTGPFSREIGPGATSTRGQLGSPFNPPSPNSEPDQAHETGIRKDGTKEESPPILPPVSPAPGTVNPMDIMAPSNLTEQTWHTNQQLYSIAHPPPKPVEPVQVPEPSQAPTPQSPEQPFEHHQQYLQQQQQQQQQQDQQQQQPQPQPIQQQQQQQRWDQTGVANGGLVANGNGHAQTNGFKAPAGGPPTEHDVRMNDVPQQVDPTHLMPDRTNHYYEGEITDPSEHSPQMGGHVSSGASYQTTPNTQIDSSPSPPSDNSSDIRNSASPYPGLQQQSPRTFMCDECGRFFDQVHKLNHHKRYHERPHECTEPNCGKRFGTKTHLDRHINDKHRKTKKFHCTVSTCPYSKTGGKSFPRKDNWRRHMVNIHQVTPMGDPEPDLVDEIMGGT